MLYFWQGFSVGLAYSAPLGLQNLFIINSALSCRRRRAFLTALIVLFFDAVLSLACFFWCWRCYAAFCLAANADFVSRESGGWLDWAGTVAC